jgi:hypothetical protein
MLLPAILLRADQLDKGTKWYQLKYDIPGLGETVIDTRPFAPFTQFLFLGDVVNDVLQYTNWQGMWTDLEEGASPEEAWSGRYEGKYTSKSMGVEAVNAFLSISQAAGTTLALMEQFTSIGERGIPSAGDMFDTFVRSVGSFLARFTIPAAQFKALSDLAETDESLARITDTSEGPMAPMAQLLANIPFVGAAVIPETYNQLTGLPLDAFMPQLRAGLGVTLQKWNRVAGEVADVGLPGQSAYIKKTGDYEIDRLVAFHYAYGIAQYADQLIFANEYYLGLDTPATKRDYLAAHVFPALKKFAIGTAMMDLGWAKMKEASEGPEQRRRRLRTQRLQDLAAEEGLSFEEGADATPEEPDERFQVPELEPEPEATPPPQASAAPPAFDRAFNAPRFEDVTG